MAARRTVYVIGAGFSAGLGYPLTSDLLIRLWEHLDDDLKKRLSKVISFHHPGFNPERFSSFPNVEQLLSEMQVNEQLFDASRQYEGKFTLTDLQHTQRDLLLAISGWFHKLSNRVVNHKDPKVAWLVKFKQRVQAEKAILISFNWDLILDALLFDEDVAPANYGFAKSASKKPVLLKPHGSLNWFEEHLGKHIKKDRRVRIFHDYTDNSAIYAFKKFRAPKSKSDRNYTPLIVPPVYLKNFEKPVFRDLWKHCTSALSSANNVVFLGYSMPLADLHAQFIIRCGFHNQREGELDKLGRRKKKTGAATVTIVNPDYQAAVRIATVTGTGKEYIWKSTPVGEWVEEFC